MSNGNVTYQSYANIPYMNVLPCITTNFGGDLQVATIPDSISAPIGVHLNGLAQQALTPPLGQLFPNVQIPSQDSINNYVNALYAPIANNLASSNINSNLLSIKITRDKLNSMLLNNKDNKEEIEALLDRLKKAEEELVELTTKSELSPVEALKESNRIGDDIRKILNDSNNIGKVKNDNDNNEDNVDNVNNNGNGTDNEENVDETDNNSNGTVQGKKGYSDDALDVADEFYDATYSSSIGTDNDKFNAVCEYLDKDNIIDVMLAWEDSHSTEKNESFMTAFMYDADRSQKIKYGKHIRNVLFKKAKELGITNECREDFAKIDKEMNSWIYVNNDVAQNYDNIIKKIAEKEGRTYNTENFKY
ncbi:MAG: hypothetical protein K2F57_00440 [Candidatus Gastranaerophilales bacterium]|nr:hypothetical protein [Candidatus Gastranaerophilales bacterium]